MGVYIKGVEMPKDGEWISVNIFHDGKCFVQSWCGMDFNFAAKLTAVPVPPHGRLIDAEELFTEFVIEGQRSRRYKLGEKWELNGEEIRRAISRLPTVIPAEPSKEET